MWGAGDLTQFRVEFSTSPEFARPLVRSRKKFAAGSTYTPSVKKWDAVRRLASPGAPIYWRVVGKVKGSKQKISSRDTNTLTFLPYSL